MTTQEGGYRIEVNAHSGNVKPFRAQVFQGERLLHKTGYCRTQAGALALAHQVVARLLLRAERGAL